MESQLALESVVGLKGNEYRTYRDIFLKVPQVERQVLTKHLYQFGWQGKITEEILDGWSINAKLYSQILSELDAVDVDAESQTAVGISRIWTIFASRAKNEYKESVLPLCWEALLYFNGVWPDWKLVTFLRMLAVIPHEQSVEPLLSFMEMSQAPSLRDLALRVLRLMPENIARQAVLKRLTILDEQARLDSQIDSQTKPLRFLLRSF